MEEIFFAVSFGFGIKFAVTRMMLFFDGLL